MRKREGQKANGGGRRTVAGVVCARGQQAPGWRMDLCHAQLFDIAARGGRLPPTPKRYGGQAGLWALGFGLWAERPGFKVGQIGLGTYGMYRTDGTKCPAGVVKVSPAESKLIQGHLR